jgi:hypothetical protein
MLFAFIRGEKVRVTELVRSTLARVLPPASESDVYSDWLTIDCLDYPYTRK